MSNQGSKPSVWLLIVLLLSLLIGACSPADDQASGSVETAVASTLEFEHAVATAAAATQASPAQDPTVESTPTAAESPTPTLEPTSEQITIKANVNTNCRLGPDPVYTVIGYLTLGETSVVLGQLAGGGWWYIQNTTAGRDPCWVWGQTTVVEGDTSGLPYITPPPTPTPLPGWTGNWSTHIESQNDYTFYIQQSGDYISAAFSNVVLYGTLSDYNQTASGTLSSAVTPVATVPPTSEPTYSFVWRMLSNGNQFRGYLDYQGSRYAWCGARNGYSLPDPCLGP